jgi:hypothetical protein
VLALVLALLPAGLQPAWLASFMQWLGLWLWLWLTVVWLISLLKRDASIMDIAYGFLLLCAPWWLFWHLGGQAQPSSVLLLALCSLGFGRYGLYILWRNLPHGEDPRYARWRQRSGARFWWWSYFQVFLLQGVVVWLWSVPLVIALHHPGHSRPGMPWPRWSGWWALCLRPVATGSSPASSASAAIARRCSDRFVEPHPPPQLLWPDLHVVGLWLHGPGPPLGLVVAAVHGLCHLVHEQRLGHLADGAPHGQDQARLRRLLRPRAGFFPAPVAPSAQSKELA